MATVKGDVHDIGKNIVGVVLQCNNFEVIDLGVMVPMEKIIATALERNADMIGLSGLITPSLDEMVYVAAEMQRQGLNLPLLIGGATTSKAHTAVRIEPAYPNAPTVYVTDASRSVSVVSQLVSEELRHPFVEGVREEYEAIRVRSAARESKRALLSLQEARANRFQWEWQRYRPPAPRQPGVHRIENLPLTELVPYIDWSPFFMTWELAGKYPKILQDDVVGESARQLFADAQDMLDAVIRDGRLQAHGVVGLWPCNRLGDDDLVLYTDDSRTKELARLYHLRQQALKPEGQPNFCLADFVAPAPVPDYLGGFAVTAGHGIEAVLADHPNDDYSQIMIKALADRLAEAFAEYLHAQVRRSYWGYAADESLDNDSLIREAYQGIRPAPGYPACPEHSEKTTLFELLDAPGNAHMSLTESYAMTPAASVAGWYFSHPESRYFGIGKIADDQLAEYAERKGLDRETARQLLRPVLRD
jgi:5-methyltetrahydrofolate--homocysteine methyltransferase